MAIKKPKYDKNPKYPDLGNFQKLMDWAVRSAKQISKSMDKTFKAVLPNRCGQCGDTLLEEYEIKRKTCGACIHITAITE